MDPETTLLSKGSTWQKKNHATFLSLDAVIDLCYYEFSIEENNQTFPIYVFIFNQCGENLDPLLTKMFTALCFSAYGYLLDDLICSPAKSKYLQREWHWLPCAVSKVLERDC